MITLGDVQEARARIRGRARRSPLERSHTLSEAVGEEIFLKLESLQRTGSFKLRGALSALGALEPAERAAGVVTASAGNHGLGVALAGRELGLRTTVVVPAGAPETKRLRIAALGADLRTVSGGYDDADREARSLAARTGAVYVHAFSDPRVVAGQGTVALEILEDLPDVQTVVVPVGGGGLAGGVGVVVRALAPQARVVGVQSVHASAMHESLSAGEPRPGLTGPTLCDGLTGDVDLASLALAAEVLDEVTLVPEEEVRAAVRQLYREEGLTAEGSAAVGPAALWSRLVPGLRGPVAVVLTGSNIDARVLARVLDD